jgi:uncharacterized C2H2 Zn-finger protein
MGNGNSSTENLLKTSIEESLFEILIKSLIDDLKHLLDTNTDTDVKRKQKTLIKILIDGKNELLSESKKQIVNFKLKENVIEKFYEALSSLVLAETFSKLIKIVELSKVGLRQLKNEKNLTFFQITKTLEQNNAHTTQNPTNPTSLNNTLTEHIDIINQILLNSSSPSSNDSTTTTITTTSTLNDLATETTHKSIDNSTSEILFDKNLLKNLEADLFENDSTSLNVFKSILSSSSDESAASISMTEKNSVPIAENSTNAPIAFKLEQTVPHETPNTSSISKKTESSKRSITPDNNEHETNSNKKFKADLSNDSDTIFVKSESLVPKSSSQLFECTECPKKFSRQANYNKHLKTHALDANNEEESVRRFKCNECSESFFYSWELKLHTRSHTGNRATPVVDTATGAATKLFGCEICEKRFTTKFSLKNHMKLHSGEGTLQCAFCSKAYITSSGLLRHQKKNCKSKQS